MREEGLGGGDGGGFVVVERLWLGGRARDSRLA